MWGAWIQRWNYAPSSISTTHRTQRVWVRTSNEITHRRVAVSQVIRWLPGAMPHKAKHGTKIQSCIMDKPPGTSQRTVSCHSEVRAFEEAGSLSVPRATPSGPNRVAPNPLQQR